MQSIERCSELESILCRCCVAWAEIMIGSSRIDLRFRWIVPWRSERRCRADSCLWKFIYEYLFLNKIREQDRAICLARERKSRERLQWEDGSGRGKGEEGNIDAEERYTFRCWISSSFELCSNLPYNVERYISDIASDRCVRPRTNALASRLRNTNGYNTLRLDINHYSYRHHYIYYLQGSDKARSMGPREKTCAWRTPISTRCDRSRSHF